MTKLRLIALLGLAAAGLGVCAGAEERERHTWALGVERTDSAGKVVSWSAAGPLLFKKTTATGDTMSGFRPFWVQTKTPNGELRSAWVFYPVFTYRADEDTYAWSFLNIVNRGGRKAGAPPPPSMLTDGEAFDVWPFWFSRQNSDPETSYRALLPVAGTIKSRFGYDRLSWTAFPFYFKSEKRGAVTTQTPFPFVRVTRGEAHGFALWPLFGWQERPGESRQEFYLWPLGYNNTTQPRADDPAGTAPKREIGALPFYARSTAPGYVNQDFVWPFFGYTDRIAPQQNYHETRYLWPFLVQGRGDNRYVNRWGPFYTNSLIKGYDKTWIGWPFYRRGEWTDQGLAQTKTQFLYFLYWSLEQRSATNPRLAPASVTHAWPLFSQWDNGAGHRQWQVLSPFEVFFSGNEKVHETWAPLFALARYDQRSPGNERFSLLRDIFTWERHAAPTASNEPAPREQRIALGRGLIGIKRAPGESRWRLFWLDFPAKRASLSTASTR